MKQMPTEARMWRAFCAKDSQFDGVFFVAVQTTGVFCRPTCRAKPPRRENVAFFGSATEAVREGYRACKICRPEEAAGRAPAVVERLEDLVRASGSPVRERDLVAIGIDPSS